MPRVAGGCRRGDPRHVRVARRPCVVGRVVGHPVVLPAATHDGPSILVQDLPAPQAWLGPQIYPYPVSWSADRRRHLRRSLPSEVLGDERSPTSLGGARPGPRRARHNSANLRQYSRAPLRSAACRPTFWRNRRNAGRRPGHSGSSASPVGRSPSSWSGSAGTLQGSRPPPDARLRSQLPLDGSGPAIARLEAAMRVAQGGRDRDERDRRRARRRCSDAREPPLARCGIRSRGRAAGRGDRRRDARTRRRARLEARPR